MKKLQKKMLIIELNEFCPKYLKEAAEKLDLVNLKKILKFRHSHTFTKEKKEFHGLDPWVQWVSIHNGISLKEHGVKRLGIDEKYPKKQIWNTLSNKKNLSWVVTGVMNAKKGSSKGCISFFPDPWSSSEKAYPIELNNLLELPRYVSKNYLSLNYFKVLRKMFKSLLFFLSIRNLGITKLLIKKLVKSLFKPGINIHTLTTLLDYILVIYFSKIKLNRKPDLSIIFLNHIAHLQHHFWLNSPEIHPQMEHGLRICDEIIEILLNSTKDNEKVILINALKQEISDKNGIQVYKQKNTRDLLNKLDILNVKIEQNMTNECHLHFSNFYQTESAFKKLSECQLSTGEKLFFLERISNLKIFMQLNCNHKISKETYIFMNNEKIPFYELFKNLPRTGSHIPRGDIYSKNIKLPEKLENHEIYNHIYNSFN